MRIWLLDEGTPGHTVQTKGVGEILGRLPGSHVEWIPCRLKLPGWKRPLTRLRVGGKTRGTALGLARKLYPGLNLPESGEVDLIVSSCGKSAYLNRLLSIHFGARGVFIGELKPFPERWFDLVITPVRQGLSNELLAPVIETGRSLGKTEKMKAEHWRNLPPASCWTILIGGASRTHRFGEGDWECLANGINALSNAHGIRWFLSTSRRTGESAEAILKKFIVPENLAEAVWWGEKPKKVVGPFLAAGERIFVTQDSLTMMSEALAMGKRAELLCPEDWEMPEESFNGRYVGRLMADGLVGRTDIGDLKNYQPVEIGIVSIESMREEFAQRLLSWVKEKKVDS